MKQSQCSDFFIYFFRSPFGQTRGNGLKTIWTHLGSYNYALGLEIFQPTQWPTLWLQESSTKQTDQSCYRSLFCLKTSASCTLMIHRIAKMLVWKRKKNRIFFDISNSCWPAAIENAPVAWQNYSTSALKMCGLKLILNWFLWKSMKSSTIYETLILPFLVVGRIFTL